MSLPGQNMLPLDPSLGTDHPPVNIFKAGFDCTIPLVGHVDRLAYEAATVSEPLAPPAKTRPMSEDELTQEMQKRPSREAADVEGKSLRSCWVLGHFCGVGQHFW